MGFLTDLDLRPLPRAYAGEIAFEPIGFAFGAGANPLEVVVVSANKTPKAGELRDAWKKRSRGRVSPILIVALHDSRRNATVCGPAPLPQKTEPPVHPSMSADKAERVCRAALDKPDRHAAWSFLQDTLPEVNDRILGLLNQGLLATHALERFVHERSDWRAAIQRSRPLRRQRKRALMTSLGYRVERRPGRLHALSHADRPLAIAVFLNPGESVSSRQDRFSQRTPIEAALARADQEGLPWVIAATDDALSLYPVETGVGVGQRGRSETFTQLHPDLLSAEQIGYLWLLFSAESLLPDGALSEALKDSRQYAAELGKRLRNRIYEDVIPQLAESIAGARGLTHPDRAQLDQTYQMALTVLFRLLFIAYAEDKGLLPYRTDDEYEDYSLNLRAQQLLSREEKRVPFDDAPLMWKRVGGFVRRYRQGQLRLGHPAL